MNREQKKKVAKDFNLIFQTCEVVILLKNKGVNTSDGNELRRLVKRVSGKYVVTKNKLAKIAIKGTEFEHLSDMFLGPIAIAYSNDLVSISKILVEFCEKNEKLELLGGSIKDNKILAKDIKAYAKLPSLDELRAKLIGLINAPASQLARILKEPASKVARVINTYSKTTKK